MSNALLKLCLTNRTLTRNRCQVKGAKPGVSDPLMRAARWLGGYRSVVTFCRIFNLDEVVSAGSPAIRRPILCPSHPPDPGRFLRLSPSSHDGTIPPLEDGDRLTRESSCDVTRRCPTQESRAHRWSRLRAFTGQSATPRKTSFEPRRFAIPVQAQGRRESKSGDNSTVALDLNNCPQPDVVLFIKPDLGGQVTARRQGLYRRRPRLVAEIAASSVSHDLHDKLQVLRAQRCARVLWSGDVDDHEVDWFVLRNGRFEKLAPDADGTLRSTVFPGLWLDPAALIRENFDKLLQVLQSGLDSPEHAEFTGRLKHQ